MSVSRPCPVCGSEEIKRIVWTDDAAALAAAKDPEIAFLNGPPAWNESAGPDRVCCVCEERFCAELAEQEKYDEDTRRQKRRIEAMKRGDYMLFDVNTTSVDEIVEVVWRNIKAKRDEKDSS